MNVFDEVRHRLDDMVQVAEVNGFEVKRGFISCPFHGSDTTPSLKLYRNSWYCYGCGEGGDAVTFVSKLYNLTPLESVRRLDRDFHLDLPLDRPPSPQERQRAETEIRRRRRLSESREAFTAWRDKALDQLNSAFRVGHEALLLLEDPNELTDAEALAIREMSHMEYLADTLSSGPLEAQLSILEQWREVQATCEKILLPRNTPKGLTA